MKTTRAAKYRLRTIAWRDTIYLELLFTWCFIGWTIALLWPGNNLLRGPSYGPLSQATDGATWPYACLMGFTATITLFGALVGRVRIRALAAALGTSIWLAVASNFVLSGTVITGFFVYGGFAVSSFLILVNHVRTVR